MESCIIKKDYSKSKNDDKIIWKNAQYGKKSEFVIQSNQKPVSVQIHIGISRRHLILQSLDKLRKADISPAKGSFRLAPNTVFWWHYLMLLYITRQPIGLSCCLY